MIHPFRSSIIVTDPWHPSDTDVPEISANAFDLCCKALETVRIRGQSTAVLLYGEAGNGKTHLLGRFQQYLRNRPQLHIFISVRLQTSPHRFWRHIRKSFADSLVRPLETGGSQLERLCAQRFSQLPGPVKKKISLPGFMARLDKKISLSQKLERLAERLAPEPRIQALRRLGAVSDISPNLCRVLEHFLSASHRQEAAAWLRGDSLPEQSLRNLGLAQTNASDDPEYEAREMVKELCRLAGPEIPVVICFDQIEALQRYPKGDDEGVFVFGKAVRALHDETSNALLVSCIQSYFLESLQKAVESPDYDAISVHQETLNPLTAPQAVKLVRARLENCSDLSEEKKASLGAGFEKELERFVGSDGKTARRVLSYCADLFDLWETGQRAPDISDETFLSHENIRREKHALENMYPEKADEIIPRAVPVLANLLDDQRKTQDKNLPGDIDLILTGRGSKVGISLCNEKDMNKQTRRFKKLLELFGKGGFDHLVIIRHAQLEISETAKKGREYLQALRNQNAVIIHPDNALLAALDAAASLLADAGAGDLSNRGRTVSSETVRKWLKTHLSGSVRDFLSNI